MPVGNIWIRKSCAIGPLSRPVVRRILELFAGKLFKHSQSREAAGLTAYLVFAPVLPPCYYLFLWPLPIPTSEPLPSKPCHLHWCHPTPGNLNSHSCRERLGCLSRL